MAQADQPGSGPRELTFISETIGGTRFFAIVFIVVGVGVIGLGLIQPDPVWFVAGGGIALLLGVVALYGISGGYPRLRISGKSLWLESRWSASKPLDLGELGAAHVFEQQVSQGYQSRRDLYLGFLRRNEEQALLDSGKPVPRERPGFYKTLAVGVLIGSSRPRAEALAELVNDHRPTDVLVLSDAERAQLVGRVAGRRWFFILLGAGLFAALILAVYLLRATT